MTALEIILTIIFGIGVIAAVALVILILMASKISKQ